MNEDSKKQAKQEKPINPNREALIEKSILARELRDNTPELEEHTINEIIVEYFYSDDEHVEFNTFNQWKRQGAVIKKGSKSFPVWGQPIKATDSKVDTKGMTEEEIEKAKYQYWPICYLFSNAQVVFPNEEREERQEAQQQEQQEIKEAIAEVVLDDL